MPTGCKARSNTAKSGLGHQLQLQLCMHASGHKRMQARGLLSQKQPAGCACHPHMPLLELLDM